MNWDLFLIGNSWPATIAVYGLSILVLVLLVRYWVSIRTFSSEVKVELQKASWPWDPKEKGMKKYKELIDSTVIVLIATLLMGGYVAGWDFILNVVLGFIFGTPHK